MDAKVRIQGADIPEGIRNTVNQEKADLVAVAMDMEGEISQDRSRIIVRGSQSVSILSVMGR